ncbi:LADA_0B11232g1_1 [Lachancea dasiensis]|uniref:LADA_0B11232g1_1 n=1 Tax=Lachancea dasiensis TaxID=1072105 RepID=A0A1G4IVY5_9SACH|nr:LADA_0B11232g1_1 [Lachancea dasiensis]
METELLEDFLLAGAGTDAASYSLDDVDKQRDEDLFSAFINTDMLQQQHYDTPAASNYTVLAGRGDGDGDMDLDQDQDQDQDQDPDPEARHAESSTKKSISPLDPLPTMLTAPPNPAERLVDHALEFGRSKPIQSAYLNAADFLNLPDQALPYRLEVGGMPVTSRVETQIKLELAISPPPPEGLVHLPSDCITKHKWHLAEDITTYQPEVQHQMLYVEAFLICASNGKPTYVCSRCVKREQRRASRRKSGLCDNLLWCNNENRRAVVFNSRQVFAIKDHQCDEVAKRFDLSTRVVCYCRHHKEPEGFKILFVLRNARQEVLAKTVTGPIMIMDKKSSSAKDSGAQTTGSAGDSASAGAFDATDGEHSERSEIPHLTSTSDLENFKSEHDLVSLALPKSQHMLSPTSLGGESSETLGGASAAAAAPVANANTSPYARRQGAKRKRSSPDFRSHGYNSVLYPGSNPNFTFHDFVKPLPPVQLGKSLSTSSSNQSLSQLQQAPAPVSSSLGVGPSIDAQQRSLPYINRVIPAQGPVKGGIEVTLLGSHFKPGMIVKFGENKALSTQCWSESTMVTYLPPSCKSGEVLVTVFDKEDEQHLDLLGPMSNSKATFTYVDDTDRQLIELALQIVGLKMNGKLEDARNIAKRIVGHDSGPSNNSPDSIAANGSQNNYSTGHGQVMFSDESLLLRVVKLLNSSSNLSMCDEEGQTLLHLACLKGYFQLASTLVRKGARVDAKDSFGLYPLHFACLNGDARIIRLLVQCKAAIHVEAMNGATPRELFINNHDTDDERYEDYLNEVLDVLDIDFSTEEQSTFMGRKLSDSSFQSSVLDAGSLASLNDNFQVHISKMTEDRLSDDDGDLDDYEEDGDEGLLQDDEDYVISDDASENSGSGNSTKSYNPNGGSTQGNNDRSTLPDLSPAVSTAIGSGNGNRRASHDANTTESSIWNRMLTALNDELPKYEDLFPTSGKEKHTHQVNREHTHALESSPGPDSLSAITSSAAEDSQTSSEDEEDALQARLNRFFQQRQNFRNDKMLLFFWLPLTIVLLSSFLLFEFGNDGNTIHHWSKQVSEYLRVGLANVMLGNERVKGAFKDSFHSLQVGIVDGSS